MSNESKCPFTGGMLQHTTAGAKGNGDWWPNQLNLAILHQQSSLSNPMGEAFDYAKEFKSLDLDAVMARRLRPLRGAVYPHGVALRRHLPDPRWTRRRGSRFATFCAAE
jgi:hypothetical protein